MGMREKINRDEIYTSAIGENPCSWRDLPLGTVITKEMVYAMRPQMYAGGLPSERYEQILGKRVLRDMKNSIL